MAAVREALYEAALAKIRATKTGAGPSNTQEAGSAPFLDVLVKICNRLVPVDFELLAQLPPGESLKLKHYIVCTVQEVLRAANELDCGLCVHHDFLYVYNGEYWQMVDRGVLQRYFSLCAERLGVDQITARYHRFSEELCKQFFALAYLPKPLRGAEPVLINLKNGTFEICRTDRRLRPFHPGDFMTYQLPFGYDQEVPAPQWLAFLNEVLPDKTQQDILAEYIGYVFAKHLKLEKTLFLYGTGANGKSVVFEVINALLGRENVSNYSLESLNEPYYRAMIEDKLLNYSSEISSRIQADRFKQLTSGEAIEARLPYGKPRIIEGYARLAFNCNDLPRDIEHTEAYFRRFLILMFVIKIHEDRRDPQLARKIIESELAGVFNWALQGLERLLANGDFTPSETVERALETYRRESDSVAMFVDEEGYTPDREETDYESLKDLHKAYREYCLDAGYKGVGRSTFRKRLEGLGFETRRRGRGFIVFLVRD